MIHTWRGFTIIELLVVLALLAVIALIGVGSIRDYAYQQQLQVAEQELVSLVRDTRQKTVAAETPAQFGLRFSADGVTRFVGPEFGADPATHETFTLPGASLTFALSDGSSDIIYARLTGVPSATGTMQLTEPQTGRTRSLRVNDAGLLVAE